MNSIVIDVREPDEYHSAHVKDALNIPSSEISSSADRFSEIPKDSPIIVYCRSGKRAGAAQEILKSWGYINVINGISQENVEATYGL